MFYNDKGEEVERYRLDPTIGRYGVNIPAGQWHSLEIIEDAVIFETREGLYSGNEKNGLVL